MNPYQPVAVGDESHQRSSCAIKTSTRGHDIEVKVYDGSPVGAACDLAIAAYWDVWDRMAAELMSRTGKAV